MFPYKASDKFVNGGVHAQVLDFPAVLSCVADLDDARRMLGIALIDVAETLIEIGEALPRPDPSASDPAMNLEEPIDLRLSYRGCLASARSIYPSMIRHESS